MIRFLKSIFNFIFPIKGKNNHITGRLRLIGKVYIRGNNNTIICNSKSVWVGVKIKIFGNNNTLIIHSGVVMKKGVIWFEDSGNLIEIGEHTTIEGAELAVAEENTTLKIGNDCMLSSDIRIATTDSHSVTDITGTKRLNSAKDVNIGNHVWIGNGVKINKGVVIGDNSVIAGYSVMTKSCPPNTICAGIPAQIKKYNINWTRKRF